LLILHENAWAAMCRSGLDILPGFGVQSFAAVKGQGVRYEKPAGQARKAGGTMNTLLWIAQILLGGIFLFTGASKLFAYQKLVKTLEGRSKGGQIGLSRGQAAAIALLEIAGAAGVLLPFDTWPPYILLRLAAGGLALLMVAAGIYHLRRQESASPTVAIFLLALFVIVGRWPR
jgi:uncharacterized membrane protein YphA (DoxX/SURF4 family)